MQFKFSAPLLLWPTDTAAWHYVEVPKDIVESLPEATASRGVLRVNASIEDFAWQTSIMPAGPGRKIVPIKADVRKKLNLKLNDQINLQLKIDPSVL